MNPKKTKINQPCKAMASLLFVALLTFINSASAQLIVTGNSQLGGGLPFSPSWTPVTGGLLDNMAPTTATGTFGQFGTGGSANNLTTVGESVQVRNYSGAGNLEICGDAAVRNDGPPYSVGTLLVYTLTNGAPTYGYNITNITVYGGWQDNGRDEQDYTISYSTVDNPTNFKNLTGVRYNPSNPSAAPCATRVIISDASGGLIAANVYALQIDFTYPGGNDGNANNASGYMAITAQGAVAAGMTTATTTYTNQVVPPGTPPSWTLETPSLIAGMAPSAFTGGGFTDYGTTGTPALTDGAIQNADSGATYCWGGSGDGAQTLTYTLTNSVNGSDLTNIVVYSGWSNTDRDGQFYNISYSTVSAPTTFNPLAYVFYNPNVSGIPSDRVAIKTPTGAPFAKNVYALKFDFTMQAGDMDNGFSGYSEIIVQGTNSAPPAHGLSPALVQDTLPAYAETVVGDQVVFTAAYSNTPPAALQWLVIKSGVTNIISGATSSTLTLNNVQVTDSGTYLLMATNTTDGTALPSYSTGAPLVVSTNPAPVNGVVVNYASQSFPGSATNFFPAWTINTSADLIHGFTSGSGPGTFTALGVHFEGDGSCNSDPTILSDGLIAPLTSLPTSSYCGCGPADVNVGVAMTYTLNSTPYGIDLTNITVFGGWANGGRDEQKYRVLYSTVQAPNTFNALVSADYLPANPNNQPTVSRTTLVPSGGVILHNVAAVKISWDVSPLPENLWEGYSEIVVGGSPSAGLSLVVTNDITPATASDVVGSQLTITAGFSGATSLQWQFNGTNVPGATSSTLTLNNLQMTNSGNYTLVASDGIHTTTSGACTVTVNPAPSATNNIITAIATQTSISDVFTPTWNPSQLTSSLIYNTLPSASGNGGSFSDGFFAPGPYEVAAGGLPVLTDGTYGTINYEQTGGFSWVALMGSGVNDANNNIVGGQYVTYTLPVSTNGYDITNIVTGGGWVDSGRDEQDYVVSYATTANTNLFIPLASVDYNPSNPAGYSTTRATITSASGVLASNVVALQFNMQNDGNGFAGYSELAVYGSPSAIVPTVPSLANPTVSGGNLILTGTGGTPNAGYTILTTTNLSPPVVWTVSITGNLDGSGNLSNAIPINVSQPDSFFRLRLP